MEAIVRAWSVHTTHTRHPVCTHPPRVGGCNLWDMAGSAAGLPLFTFAPSTTSRIGVGDAGALVGALTKGLLSATGFFGPRFSDAMFVTAVPSLTVSLVNLDTCWCFEKHERVMATPDFLQYSSLHQPPQDPKHNLPPPLTHTYCVAVLCLSAGWEKSPEPLSGPCISL